MPRTRRSFIGRLGVVSMVPLLAGCSSDGMNTGTQQTVTTTGTESTEPTGETTPTHMTITETATSTPTATVTPTGQNQYPNYNWGKLDDVEPVQTTEVILSGSSFEPLIASITPGTTVTWTNDDSFDHTVTIPKLAVDSRLSRGDSVEVTFQTADTYDYVCRLHPPGMLGRIVVES